jgi:rhodanese-related sulfurtransferase
MFTSLPEISVQALAEKLKNAGNFTLLDVREPWELNYARLDDPRVLNLPTSQISRLGREAFPEALRAPEAEIVVICHHGVRSANVTSWMLANGWKNVHSAAGGIAAYAEEVDPTVGSY